METNPYEGGYATLITASEQPSSEDEWVQDYDNVEEPDV